SHRYPTIELRIADSCTRVDDALVLACLYWCLVQALIADGRCTDGIIASSWPLVDENRWRAQREGATASLLDASGRLHSLAWYCESLLALIEPTARRLGCMGQLRLIENLLAQGTSASEQ